MLNNKYNVCYRRTNTKLHLINCIRVRNTSISLITSVFVPIHHGWKYCTEFIIMMASSNGNFFCVTGRWPVNSPHKGQWRGALMFYLTCACINGWVNSGEAGDLRRHHGHYDLTLMYIKHSDKISCPRVTSTECFLSGMAHFWHTCLLLRWAETHVMIVHFSAHSWKWEFVCKFGVIFHIFIISCLGSRFHAWNKLIFLLIDNLFIYQILCTLLYRRRSLYSFLSA